MIWRGAATGTAAAAGAEAEVESGAGAEAKVCAEALAVASLGSSSTARAPQGTWYGFSIRTLYLGEPQRYLRHPPLPFCPGSPPLPLPSTLRTCVGRYVRTCSNFHSSPFQFNSNPFTIPYNFPANSSEFKYVCTYVRTHVRTYVRA